MSEPVPFRLRVLIALNGVLESIARVDGYANDMAGKVFRGRDLFGDDDPLPMVAILEPPVEPESLSPPTGAGGDYSDWELLLQGFVDKDVVNPEHATDPAHHLLADVKKKLWAEKKKALTWNTLGFESGRVEIKRVGRGIVRPPDEVSAVAYFWLPLTLRIAEDEDPFA